MYWPLWQNCTRKLITDCKGTTMYCFICTHTCHLMSTTPEGLSNLSPQFANINQKITVNLLKSHPANSELQHVCPDSVLREVELSPVHCSTWQWCQRAVSFGLPSALLGHLLKRHRHLVGWAVDLQPQSAGRERAPSSLLLLTATHPTYEQRVIKRT